MSIELECSIVQSFEYPIEEREHSSLSPISKPNQSLLFSSLEGDLSANFVQGIRCRLLFRQGKNLHLLGEEEEEETLKTFFSTNEKTAYEMIRLIDLLLLILGNDIEITLMFTCREFHQDLFITGWRKNSSVFFSIDNDLNLSNGCQSPSEKDETDLIMFDQISDDR